MTKTCNIIFFVIQLKMLVYILKQNTMRELIYAVAGCTLFYILGCAMILIFSK